jgi:hypothetical protein
MNRPVILRCSICLLLAYALLGTTVRFNAQPVLAQGCDYYASPTGGGNGLSESTPFQIGDFWSVAEAGDTLCLLDGKYTGSRSMIIPPSSVNGTAGNPITISALNDGMVELDGEGSYDPIDLSGNDYLIIEGINAHNAGIRAVVHIHNGADHNIIRRVCAWDAPDANTEIFGAHGSEYNLFEDCAGWGIARKIFSNSQGGDHTTFRRCYGKWMHHTAGSPKCTFTSSYNSFYALLENCIGTWDEDAEFNIDEPYGIFRGGRSDGSKETFERHYGNIAYLLGDYDFQAEQMYFWQNQYNIEFQDCISYIEGESHDDVYSFRIYPYSDNGISLKNITSIGGAGLSCPNHECDIQNHYQADTASELTANGGSVLMPSMNGITDGATVCYRYVDGVLTDEPLWPWPMNQRIVDAMILSGREPVDVTATIEQIFGPIPAECKGEELTEDINFDGRVNTQDVQYCINVFLGWETNADIVKRADVNGDEKVDLLDIQQITRRILGG